MPELRRCSCGADYWFPGQRWQHEGCATNDDATNVQMGGTKEEAAPAIRCGRIPERGNDRGGVLDGAARDEVVSVAALTKNRRSREAYNSYQREYMRKKRERMKASRKMS
jgi:hypothetical protein